MGNARIKPIYNCERLVIWPMISEDAETYGEPLSFTRRLMTYDDNVESNTTDLYGDGINVDSEIEEGKGTLALGIHGLSDEEFAAIFGAATKNGTIVETGDEVSVYCCVALLARRSKNIVTVRKWPKVRFAKQQETVQQKQGSKTFSTPTLNGTFVYCERLAAKRLRKTIDVSTVEGAAFLEGWFGSADFISSEELINTSYLTYDGGTDPIAGAVHEGDVIINGAATGGTSPYTYSYYYQVLDGGTWSSYTAAGEDVSAASNAISIDAGLTYRLKAVVKDTVGQELSKTFKFTAVAAN